MQHGLASLPVVDGQGQVEGIITESDIVGAVSDGRDFERTKVGSIMTRNPVTVGEDVNASQAALAMCRSHARHLPVTRGGRMVGIVFDRDLIRKMRKDVYAHQPAEYV